jgi:hypothetical protein
MRGHGAVELRLRERAGQLETNKHKFQFVSGCNTTIANKRLTRQTATFLPDRGFSTVSDLAAWIL